MLEVNIQRGGIYCFNFPVVIFKNSSICRKFEITKLVFKYRR